MAISAKQFVANARKLQKQPMTVLKEDIVLIVFRILHQISEYTITDTAHARSLVIKKFSDKYSLDADDLREQYFFWENSGFPENASRRWDGEGSTLTDNWGSNKYDFNLTIKDEAFQLMEDKKMTPSNYHASNTGRDNSQFKLGMVQLVADKVNAGMFGDVDKLDEAINSLLKHIEKFLLGG